MRKAGGAFALCVLLAAMPGAAGAETTQTTETLTVAPAADTYVSSESKAKSYGAYAYMTVDGSPSKTAFLRFDVAGIGARTITNARLRLHQVDTTKLGGRVLAMSNAAWPESVTWNTQPAIDGPALAQFGAAASGQWYEVSLGATAVKGDGPVSFAIDNPGTDGSKWASRESANPPQLLIDVAGEPPPPPPPPPPPSEEGVSTIAGPTIGSSDPTFFAMQHRVVRTSSGRVLAVYGRHASGVDLAWRDGGGAWSTTPLLAGTGTGDWPASIVTAWGADGKEHGWVAWGGTTGFGEKPRPVQMRHLYDVNAPGGPVPGAVVQVAEPGAAGNGRVDIAMEQLPNGAARGWVFWVRRTNTSDTASEHYVASFDGIESDTPTLNPPTLLLSNPNPSLATFVDSTGTAAGLRLVMRTSGSNLTVYRHDPAVAVGGWSTLKAGMTISGSSRPAAAALPNGEVLVAVESNTNNDIVTVQRFAVDGTPKAIELSMTGYREPTIAVMKSGAAVLVAIRAADGVLVSRTLATATTWSTEDRVELGAEGGGNYQWPNAVRQSDDTLRLVVRGPAAASYQTSVLSVVRSL